MKIKRNFIVNKIIDYLHYKKNYIIVLNELHSHVLDWSKEKDHIKLSKKWKDKHSVFWVSRKIWDCHN